MSNSMKSMRLAKGMSRSFCFVLLLLTCGVLSSQNQSNRFRGRQDGSDQFEGKFMQLRPRLNRRFYRPAAGGYLEVSPFNLHCNGSTKTIRFLTPSPNIVGHRDHAGFDPGRIDQILREGRLRPGRFSLSVGLNRAIVPATRDFKVPMACFAEPRPQKLKGLAPQIRACLNAKRVHLGRGLRARQETSRSEAQPRRLRLRRA